MVDNYQEDLKWITHFRVLLRGGGVQQELIGAL